MITDEHCSFLDPEWLPYRQAAEGPLPEKGQACWVYYTDDVLDQNTFDGFRFQLDDEVLYWKPVIEPRPPGKDE